MSNDLKIPTPTTLSHNGKTYTLTPLGARDMVEHADYLHELYMEKAKKDLCGLPKEIAIEAYKDAKKYADKIQPVTAEYIELSQTLAGITYQFFIAARKKHPEITLQLAGEILESNFAEIAAKSNQMAGYKAVDELDPLAKTEVA